MINHISLASYSFQVQHKRKDKVQVALYHVCSSTLIFQCCISPYDAVGTGYLCLYLRVGGSEAKSLATARNG